MLLTPASYASLSSSSLSGVLAVPHPLHPPHPAPLRLLRDPLHLLLHLPRPHLHPRPLPLVLLLRQGLSLPDPLLKPSDRPALSPVGQEAPEDPNPPLRSLDRKSVV